MVTRGRAADSAPRDARHRTRPCASRSPGWPRRSCSKRQRAGPHAPTPDLESRPLLGASRHGPPTPTASASSRTGASGRRSSPSSSRRRTRVRRGGRGARGRGPGSRPARRSGAGSRPGRPGPLRVRDACGSRSRASSVYAAYDALRTALLERRRRPLGRARSSSRRGRAVLMVDAPRTALPSSWIACCRPTRRPIWRSGPSSSAATACGWSSSWTPPAPAPVSRATPAGRRRQLTPETPNRY